MKTELVGNSLEVSLSPSDAMSFGLSFVLATALALLAGWQVAFVVCGLSLLGAVGIDLAQRLDE